MRTMQIKLRKPIIRYEDAGGDCVIVPLGAIGTVDSVSIHRNKVNGSEHIGAVLVTFNAAIVIDTDEDPPKHATTAYGRRTMIAPYAIDVEADEIEFVGTDGSDD